MIRVTLRLESAVDARRDRTLAVVNIANKGSGTAARGNYLVAARRGGGRTRFAGVEGFPRRSRSALELLRRGLNALAEKGELP